MVKKFLASLLLAVGLKNKKLKAESNGEEQIRGEKQKKIQKGREMKRQKEKKTEIGIVRRIAAYAKIPAMLLALVVLASVFAVPMATAREAAETDVPIPAILSEGTQTGLVVTDMMTGGVTAEDLASELLGPGVTVSNVVYNGAPVAAGKFTGGTGIIGFEKGIVLSSGRAVDVVGPNNNDAKSTGNGWAGDAFLNSLIPGYTTYDAATLEFDFIPQTDIITFSYTMTSEEYNEWVNTAYNDAFGFELNGVNIALIPGTTTPVSINNVNGGGPAYGTNPSNSAYYINNDLSDGGGSINTQMDGLTVVLTATANVVPGVVNHIKLAIADAGDSALDSDVFIKSESFSSPQLTLTPLTATHYTGTIHTSTAKLVDPMNVPIAGEMITFTVTGPNAQTNSGLTGANGEVTFSYTGVNVGTDKIVATGMGLTSNDAYVTWEPSPNQPPVAEAGGPYSVDEGSSVTVSGIGSNDPDMDPLAFAWDLDNDGSFETEGMTATITPTDGPATKTVGLQVKDGKGGVSTDTATITVNNVNPTVDAGSDATINEGETFNGAGSFKDPGADTFTAHVDYGDGSLVEAIVLNSDGTFALSHMYADNGIYTLTVTVKDDDGGVGTDTMQVTVNDIVIDVGPIAVSGDVVPIGTSFTAKSTITAAPTDTGTATWDWDGATETIPLAAFPTTLSTPHTYTVPGVYTIKLSASDDDGNSDSEMYEYIVVYDPNGGFVTGGVWFDSLAGAYTADPTLTGKAHAGFVSKYQKGATVPSGETEFQFQAGDLNFHSVSYNWLNVAGAKAMYKGKGTINGTGNYGFIVSAIDGALLGGGTSDKFRIKIWDISTNVVVYDNMLGASDDADPSTAITSGSIVIHKPK